MDGPPCALVNASHLPSGDQAGGVTVSESHIVKRGSWESMLKGSAGSAVSGEVSGVIVSSRKSGREYSTRARSCQASGAVHVARCCPSGDTAIAKILPAP